MLIVHPRIYLGPDGRTTDALFVADGRIVATGDRARALAKDTAPAAERSPDLVEPAVIEPNGACLFPALADAHIHLWGLGLRAGNVDLRGLGPAHIYDALESATPGPGGWVFATNWDDNLWPPGQTLTRDALDRLFPDHPLCLRRVDSHALWVNSAALRRAGLPDGDASYYTPGPDGFAERDASGRLTGRLVDAAMNPVLASVPAPDEAEDRAVFLESARMLQGFGVACAHMAWMPVDRLPMLRALHADGALPLRAYLILDGDDPGLGALLDAGPVHDPSGWLSARAIKFFADGALGSRGAHLLEPYSGDDGAVGLRMKAEGELRARAKALLDGGWQVAVHAIGDAAAREVLDAFEAASPAARRRLRPRLEHAQMLEPSDRARFGPLSTLASIQPIHMRSDAPWAANMLGEHRLDRLFRWRELQEATVLCAGSDYPIDDPNPWHGIATALDRRDAHGRPFHPDQALTRHEALAAYTTGAAFAAHWEHLLGRLDPGFAADIIALDRDPFTATPDAIWDTRVHAMWLAGRRLY